MSSCVEGWGWVTRGRNATSLTHTCVHPLADKYFVMNPLHGDAEARVETTASDDSLTAVGDVQPLEDITEAPRTPTREPPGNQLSPPPPPPQPVRQSGKLAKEIVRCVTVHRRSLVVRDTFGQDLTFVDAALSELRP